MRTFENEFGDQIVMVGNYAWAWPALYERLHVGDMVLLPADHIGPTRAGRVTELGTEFGGAVGFITSRLKVDR